MSSIITLLLSFTIIIVFFTCLVALITGVRNHARAYSVKKIVDNKCNLTMSPSSTTDSIIGRVDLRYNPLPVDDDYFIPQRD